MSRIRARLSRTQLHITERAQGFLSRVRDKQPSWKKKKGRMYRPLSPHIFIYKPQWSSMFSVFHRATGIILALGLFLSISSLKFFAYHVSFGPVYIMGHFLNTYWTWIIIGIWISLLFSFLYHFSNGIRHLIWDFSPTKEKSLNVMRIQKSAYFVLLFTFLGGICILAWLAGLVPIQS